MPVYGRLEGDARAEGGDTMWLDHDTLAVGRGFRTNAEGVRQLRGLLEPLGVTVLDYDLPYFTGPEACLHLLSLISPVDVDLAVAYPPLMPTAFWAELKRRGVRLLEVPEEEFAAHAGDQRPHRGAAPLHHAGRQPGDAGSCSRWPTARSSPSPASRSRSRPRAGPTCLTRPVLRDPE